MNKRALYLVFVILATSCVALGGTTAYLNTTAHSAELAHSDTIVVATFNVRNLSNKADTARIERIASLIDQYDLSVLVEIRDTFVLDRLACVMANTTGKKYGVVSSERVGTPHRWEYYGFIYDQSRLSAKSFGGLYDDPLDSFVRNPGFQSFKSGGFDFVAVAVHITWGSGVKERRLEINALPVVLTEIEKRYFEALGEPERDLLLLGDFNRPESDQKAFGSLRMARYAPTLVGDIKTTVGDVSAFDNLFLRPEETCEYTGESGVDEFDKRLGLSPRAATAYYSDHRPVWATFRVLERDDD